LNIAPATPSQTPNGEFRLLSQVMKEILDAEPTVLHFACHGEPGVLLLRGSFLDGKELAEAIASLNREREQKGQPRVRLVVANSCMSGELARRLAEVVDFVIGHGEAPVGDAEALQFSEVLYRALGQGLSLRASFDMARPVIPARLAPFLSLFSVQLFAPLIESLEQAMLGGIPAAGPAIRSGTFLLQLHGEFTEHLFAKGNDFVWREQRGPGGVPGAAGRDGGAAGMG
jgi:hypothetical protein